MSINLEKVDQVKQRTGVSYKAAKEALEHCNGDVLEAIIYLEGSSESTYTDTSAGVNQFGQFGQDVANFFKDIIHKGNVNRITIEKDGKRIVDLPMTAGAVGAVFFTPAVIISVVVAFATGCEMSIHKEDGEVINVKDVTRETLDSVKEKINETTCQKSNCSTEEPKPEEYEEVKPVETEEQDKQ